MNSIEGAPDRPTTPNIQPPEMRQAVDGVSASVRGFFMLPGYITESSRDDAGTRHTKFPAFTETDPGLEGKAFEIFTPEDPAVPPTYRVTDGDKSWTWTEGAGKVSMQGPDNFSAELSLPGIEELQGFIAEHRKVPAGKKVSQAIARLVLRAKGDTTKY